MSLFNFITDESFRASLEADYEELERCLEGKAWKAALVLSGSLVEAILIDSLISTGVVQRTEALKMDLAEAIEQSKKAKILSAKTSDLCSAIRAYRNLIHPGRSLRLAETVDSDSATVAVSLIRIIVGEVSKKRLENYGYTAEQIVAKIERDSAVEAILTHLLKETKEVEIERLLLSVLPAKSLAARDDVASPDHLLPVLTLCFRTAFEAAPEDLKKKVAKRFVTILKEESGGVVLSYSTAYFRASDLQYLAAKDVDLVRDHLLSQCKSSSSAELFTVLEGMGAHLGKEHVNKFVDPLIRLATSSSGLSTSARVLLEGEFKSTREETDELILKRLQAWIEMYKNGPRPERAAVVEEIKASYEPWADGDIPF